MVECYNQNNFSTKKLIGYNPKVITRVITRSVLTPTLCVIEQMLNEDQLYWLNFHPEDFSLRIENNMKLFGVQV